MRGLLLLFFVALFFQRSLCGVDLHDDEALRAEVMRSFILGEERVFYVLITNMGNALHSYSLIISRL